MAGTIQHHIAKSQTNGFIEKNVNMNCHLKMVNIHHFSVYIWFFLKIQMVLDFKNKNQP